MCPWWPSFDSARPLYCTLQGPFGQDAYQTPVVRYRFLYLGGGAGRLLDEGRGLADHGIGRGLSAFPRIRSKRSWNWSNKGWESPSSSRRSSANRPISSAVHWPNHSISLRVLPGTRKGISPKRPRCSSIPFARRFTRRRLGRLIFSFFQLVSGNRSRLW